MIGWLALAASAEALGAALPRGERSASYARIAEQHGVTATTVQRSMAAARFARTQAAEYGLTVDEIGASLSSVETLRRIGRISPTDAGIYTRRALLGQMTYASLLALSRHLEFMAADERADGRHSAARRAIVERLALERGFHSFVFDADDLSEVGGLLEIDCELWNDDERAAVVLSTARLEARHFKQPVSRVLQSVVSASACYSASIFVTDDPSELRAFGTLGAKEGRIEVVSLGNVGITAPSSRAEVIGSSVQAPGEPQVLSTASEWWSTGKG